MRTHSLVISLALAAPAIAQKADLGIDRNPDDPLRISVQARFDVAQTNRILIDGEEAGFGRRGGRGGGGGDLVITQAMVLDRGPESAGWRHYRTLETTRQQGGQENKVQGALAGQRVFLRDGAWYRGEGSGAEMVPANVARGVPAKVSLAGLVPSGEFSVGDEFDVSETFLSTFRGLMHPVTPEAAAGRGGGRGGRRGGRRGGGGGDAVATLSQVLGSDALDCQATGKLVSVEQRDGKMIATVELTAALTGEGTAEEMGMGGGFGRRGRGGAGGESKASATINLKGVAAIDLDAHQLASLELGGDVDLASDSTRSTGRGEFQTIQGTKGALKINVTCEPAGR